MSNLRVFAVIIILAVGGFAFVGSSYEAAGFDRQDADFQITVSHDESISLEGTEIEDFEATNQADEELVEGDDYELNADDGVIQFLSDGNTDEGEAVQASYNAELPKDIAETIAGPITSTMALLGMVAFVIAISVVLSSLAEFPRGRF